MRTFSWLSSFLIIAVLVGLWFASDWFASVEPALTEDHEEHSQIDSELEILELSPQAQKNLNLASKPARPTEFWRTLTIPGVVEDRPGVSDRGVTATAMGSISEIHVFPGDTVHPGERLVTISLFSEYLQATQTQLFKASLEIDLLQKEIDRLSSLISVGGVAKTKLIQLQNEIQRQETLTRAANQELLNRGLSPSQVAQIALGKFVSTIDVLAPPPRSLVDSSSGEVSSQIAQVNFELDGAAQASYEVQSLAVELGQTVQSGQLIADLANHQHLYVVGHAFKREASLLEQAAQESRNVDVEFTDDAGDDWSPLEQAFQIRHLSNSIDTESRTFDVYLPLVNEARSYLKHNEHFLIWRFRPGQRVRIHVPVEKLENVFVLPAECVAYEGASAFVYRQNGNLFNQIAVHVLHEDRRTVVIANDGSITPGTYIAQTAGASLRRILKSQSASGQQPGVHVHADGTVHAAH